MTPLVYLIFEALTNNWSGALEIVNQHLSTTPIIIFIGPIIIMLKKN